MPQLTAKQQKFVSAYLGAAEGNATEACRLAGYQGNAVTLAVVGFDNLRKPQIAEAIAEALASIDRRGIAIKQRRLDAKVERWQAMLAIQRARAAAFREELAADSTTQLPPGWESGFHVRQVKAISIGRGQTTTVEEFALDATMLREFTTLEKEIAQELGERESGVNIRLSGRVDHVISRPDLSRLTDQQIESLLAIREQAIAEEATA